MRNTLPENISKYINKYTLHSREIICSHHKKIKVAIVVPAIKEFENIKKLLVSLLGNESNLFEKTMILFVVNNLKSSNYEIKNENKQTIEFLKRIIKKSPANKFENTLIKSTLNIALIDAATDENELDEKHGGVGLSRKIGMDAVLTYFDYYSPNKNTIVCLDADCTVKNNYLSLIYSGFVLKNYQAAYVNFKHILPANIKQKLAIINYEIFLRYYVLGLTFAKSPFAFHTIGSTMICDTDSYVKVGGMNKKKAAEDFYFMQKLAKLSQVHKIDGTTVYPSGRGSWRVPFGTGQRVNRFLEYSQNEYLLYSPSSFLILKKWLQIYNSDNEFNPLQLLNKAKSISIQLFNFLRANNFISDWEKILKNSKSEKQLNRQKIMWFDGFKTLKFIHYLRDNGFPNINMFEAVNIVFKLMQIPQIVDTSNFQKLPELKIQLKYLNRLREIS